MTGLPEPRLRASAMNSLAHGADSLYTPFANPVSQMTALRGAELIAGSLDRRAAPSATAPPSPRARSSAATRSTPAPSACTT